MIGPPGAGKSMLAQRVPGLLPPLDAAEALEVSMIHSVAEQLAGGKISRSRLIEKCFEAPPPVVRVPCENGLPGGKALGYRRVTFGK